MSHDALVLLLVIGAVSLALAPVYWMLPSPRQRQLARLRSHALSLGLRPEQQPLPRVLRAAGYAEDMVRYRWATPLPEWPDDGPRWLAFIDAASGGKQERRLVWLRSRGYSAGPDTLLVALEETDIAGGPVAVEAGPGGVGVYWHEAGDCDQVDRLFSLLQPWSIAYRDCMANPDSSSLTQG